MKLLNERLHKILEETVAEIEESRNVSAKADGVVMLNQMLQASNMYCEFLARVDGLEKSGFTCSGCEECETGDSESPPSE